MEKKLSIEMPPIETYQGSSFILGIVLANENIRNAFYNNYYNLVCNDTERIEEVKLQFTNVLWEEYRRNGLAEMDLYFLKNIAKEKCVDFLKERIEQGNYLLLYQIDEFCLSYSSNYKKKHFIHDTYVYGYSDTSFFVMAYKEKKLQLLEVLTEEIVEGMYSALASDPDTNFCTFRPFHYAMVQPDYKKMKEELKLFMDGSGRGKNGLVYGEQIYAVIEKCILAMINQRLDMYSKHLDLRVFRVLWEHKKVMRLHVVKVGERKTVENKNMDELEEIEHIAHNTFLLAMKYNITKKESILYDILEHISEIRRREKPVIVSFYELLSMC